jgi:hypothetical protein
LAEDLFPKLNSFMNLMPVNTGGYYPKVIGRLALKQEAAGKVRVFAMVDPITQWLLAPIHKFIFSTLRRIPMDGTFDQLRPIRNLLRNRKGSLYSLDLSAATDRLPVDLQALLLNNLDEKYRKVLSYIQNASKYKNLPWDFEIWKSNYAPRPPLGEMWKRILVERDYCLDVNETNERFFTPSDLKGSENGVLKLRYAVGQPMGALSS